MRFDSPEILFFLLLVPVFLVAIYLCGKKKKELLQQFTGDVPLISHLSAERRTARRIFRITAFLLLILALARPQWGQIMVTLKQKGTDIAFALDCSRSMLCKDLKPDRFQTARHKIKNLLGRLLADRVALIDFSGSAIIECPLTVDYSALELILDGASSGEISPPGTNLSAVLEKSRVLFKNSGEGYKNLVIITDGEDHSESLKTQISMAKNEGIRVFILVTASQDGAPVPVLKQGEIDGYQKDKDGNLVISKPDWEEMKELVESTDGRFFLSSAQDEDVDELAREISQLQKRELKNTVKIRKEERYYWPLWLALLLILAEFMLGERKNAWI
ncbi:MAG: VWA domain-containing protein [Candidatus Wallbacteria bacterium]|nr:VWA domain-containing protein [Candidatus Wallbacteria bacterium]